MASISKINVGGTDYTFNADQLQGHSASYFQQALVSGTNIKTINGESILGSGDIYIPYKGVNTCNLTLNHASANASTVTLSGTINGETMTSMTLTGTATYCNLQSDFSVIVNGKRYLTTVIITNSTVTLACGNKIKKQSLSPQNSSYVWTVTLS